MRSFPSLEDSSKLVFLAIAIKIVKGAEVDGPRGEAGGKRHGVFAYHADPELYPLVCGFSRQPLLDACRQLKSLYGVTGTLSRAVCWLKQRKAPSGRRFQTGRGDSQSTI
jgi:hypothetical protein